MALRIMISMLLCLLLTNGNSVFAEEAKVADAVDTVKEKTIRNAAQESMPQVNPVKAKTFGTRQNIDKVQKQLNEVIANNQKLQEEYLKRMEKIRAVSTQAKIHQKILDKIRTQTPQNNTAVQKAVQQEKVRLIAEQARKNQEVIKSLNTGQPQKSS